MCLLMRVVVKSLLKLALPVLLTICVFKIDVRGAIFYCIGVTSMINTGVATFQGILQIRHCLFGTYLTNNLKS